MIITVNDHSCHLADDMANATTAATETTVVVEIAIEIEEAMIGMSVTIICLNLNHHFFIII